MSFTVRRVPFDFPYKLHSFIRVAVRIDRSTAEPLERLRSKYEFLSSRNTMVEWSQYNIIGRIDSRNGESTSRFLSHVAGNTSPFEIRLTEPCWRGERNEFKVGFRIESAGLKNLITVLLPTLRGVATYDALLNPRELDLHEKMALVTTGELRGKLTKGGFGPVKIVEDLKRDYPDGLGSVIVYGLMMCYYGPEVIEKPWRFPEPVVFNFGREDRDGQQIRLKWGVLSGEIQG
jgi:hypothetical protein